MTGLFDVERTGELVATLGGVCCASEPVVLQAGAWRQRGAVSSVKADMEPMLRGLDAVCGGSLGGNFLEFAAEEWRVWHVSAVLAETLRLRPPQFFAVERKIGRAIGVEFTSVTDLSLVIPNLNSAASTAVAAAAPAGLDSDLAAASPRPPELGAICPDLAAASTAAEDAARAMARLEDLATPRPPSSSPSSSSPPSSSPSSSSPPPSSPPSTYTVNCCCRFCCFCCCFCCCCCCCCCYCRRRGGVVTHTYEPSVVLASLQLRAAVKPSASLQDIFVLVAPFLFGEAGREVFTDASMLGAPLPSMDVMRDGRIRLDLLSLLWERTQIGRFYTWRYLNPDSSPQLGWQWLVVREDSFRFSKHDHESELAAFSQGQFDAAYRTRTCMLSVFGRGRGSLVQKASMINNIHKMESGDVETHKALAAQVMGITTDQGIERGIAEVDNMERAVGEQTMGYLYPNALWMPEHLHIFFNALEHAVGKLEVYKHWINRLRQVEHFLSDGSLRRLFIHLFMRDEPGLLKHYSTVHIDWRWEMLSKALDKLIPIFNILRDRFNLQTFLRSADGGKVDANVAREAMLTMQTMIGYYQINALLC